MFDKFLFTKVIAGFILVLSFEGFASRFQVVVGLEFVAADGGGESAPGTEYPVSELDGIERDVVKDFFLGCITGKFAYLW